MLANDDLGNLGRLGNQSIITASASKKDCAAATLMCEKSADIFVGAKLLGGVKFLTKQEHV